MNIDGYHLPIPTILLFSFVFLHNSGISHQFYLPGLAPVNFCRKTESSSNCKSEVKLFVNRLNTEESIIPFEYHHFDFCTIDESDSPSENLGQVVFGERIRPGPYKIEFLKNVECEKVCTKTYLGGDSSSERPLMLLKKGIGQNYQHHWIVDNMPVTWCYPLEGDKQYCSIGFPMGCYIHQDGDDSCPISPSYNKRGVYYLFNHVDLIITYHSGETEDWGVGFGANGGRIVSVKVVPSSINQPDPAKPSCVSHDPMIIPPTLGNNQQLQITYTYSVKFVMNNAVKWSTLIGHSTFFHR